MNFFFFFFFLAITHLDGKNNQSISYDKNDKRNKLIIQLHCDSISGNFLSDEDYLSYFYNNGEYTIFVYKVDKNDKDRKYECNYSYKVNGLASISLSKLLMRTNCF